MAAVGEEAQLCDGLCVVLEGVDELLRVVVFELVAVARQFDVDVCVRARSVDDARMGGGGRMRQHTIGDMHVGPALVVVLLAAHKLARLALLGRVGIVGAGELGGRWGGVVGDVVLLVDNLDFFVAAKGVVGGRIRALLFVACPRPFVRARARHDARVTLGLALALLRMRPRLERAVAFAEACFTYEGLCGEPSGHAASTFAVPCHGSGAGAERQREARERECSKVPRFQGCPGGEA